MATPDGIGRPRPQAVVERDERVYEALVELGKKNGVNVHTVAGHLDLDVLEVQHSLRRLRTYGRAVRKGGYRWWPAAGFKLVELK